MYKYIRNILLVLIPISIITYFIIYFDDIEINLDEHLSRYSNNTNFKIFDATLYLNKPDLSNYSVTPIKIIGSSELWEKGDSGESLPDKNIINDISKHLSEDEIIIIDIEHWSLNGDDKSVNESINKYKTVIEWFRESNPSILFGYYGLIPIRDYWNSILDRNEYAYQEWQSKNNRLTQLENKVDIVFPSLYTFYPRKNEWVKYAIENIKEARRISQGKKPVYVFLWPEYHDSNKIMRFLRMNYIPSDYWRLQLEVAYKYADGVVIWGGWDFYEWKRSEWDDLSPWWKTTMNFVSDKELASRNLEDIK